MDSNDQLFMRIPIMNKHKEMMDKPIEQLEK